MYPQLGQAINVPAAKDDRLIAVANRPVVVKILDNDIDPDGNTLKIIYVTSPTKNDGTVIINKNGTVTFLPATDFTGIDSFTYTVSDRRERNMTPSIPFFISCSSTLIWQT